MAIEKRLIDVNEAIEKINCLCVDDNENWIGTANQSFVDHADVIDILSDMPTVDAVEVVHGRWIDDYDTFVQDNGYESEPIHTGFVCSVCGRHSFAIEPYCHCGAKMDGGNEDV